MSKTALINGECSCPERKISVHNVQVEDELKGSGVVDLQVECPFQHEKNCFKILTILLPAGMIPTKNGSILRG